jgi:hypothetical protein
MNKFLQSLLVTLFAAGFVAIFAVMIWVLLPNCDAARMETAGYIIAVSFGVSIVSALFASVD